jgi:stage V sporulation protein B
MAIVAWLVYHGVFRLLAGNPEAMSPGVHPVGANMLATVCAILVAMVVYVILIFAVRAVTYEELDQLPGGGVLKKVLRKFGFGGRD